ALDADHPLQQSVVKRPRKPDDERLACALLGRRNFPLTWIDGRFDRRASSESLFSAGCQRLSGSVAPGFVDNQDVLLALFEHRAEFFARLEALFHAARIEQKR